MTSNQPAELFLFLGALCVFAVAASPSTPRENIPVNSEVFVQPEYIEALDKELEREEPILGGSWWIRYQEEQRKNSESSDTANADKYRESSWHHGNLDHIGGGNLLRRNLDPIGGGNLLRRNLDQIGGGNLVKRYVDDTVNGLAALQAQEPVEPSNSNGPDLYTHSKKFTNQRVLELPNMDAVGAADRFSERILYPAQVLGLSESKRNLDEIDRSGFSGFKKRNFDEIDRSGFSGFNKRNMDEIDRSAFSGFSKRNFDEIDRSGFSGFNKRNFDEIDRSGFSGFSKRNLGNIHRSALFSTFNKKRNFDEIDRSGFSGFSKRNFDEIDRSGVPGFTKRSISKAKAAGSADRNASRPTSAA